MKVDNSSRKIDTISDNVNAYLYSYTSGLQFVQYGMESIMAFKSRDQTSD